MKLVNGVQVSTPWETAVAYFSQPNGTTAAKIPHSILRLTNLLIDSARVTLAIIDEDTLECDYKFKRLIKPKELKHTFEIIRMLQNDLRNRPHLDKSSEAALRLFISWQSLVKLQYLELNRVHTSPSIRLNNLQGKSKDVLEDFTSLLTALHMCHWMCMHFVCVQYFTKCICY